PARWRLAQIEQTARRRPVASYRDWRNAIAGASSGQRCMKGLALKMIHKLVPATVAGMPLGGVTVQAIHAQQAKGPAAVSTTSRFMSRAAAKTPAAVPQ